VFWVVTGFAGVVASYLTVRPEMSIGPVARFIFKPIDVPAGGASGALFGLVGVLFVFGIKFRHELPEGFRRAFGTGLLPMILVNLLIGYMGRGFIDNAAHLGGLFSGGILALAVTYRRPGEKSGMAITWRILQVAAIALVAVSFLMTARHFRDPFPPTVIREAEQPADPNTQKFVSWAKGMTEAQEALSQAVKTGNPGEIDGVIKAMESAPSLDPKADDLRERMKAFLVRAKALDTRDKGEPTKEQPEALKLATDFVAWSKEYKQWLKTNAKNYGLVEVSETGAPK
jgi:hypothetical protein